MVTDGLTDGQMDGQTDEQTEKQMDGWMNRWTDERTEKQNFSKKRNDAFFFFKRNRNQLGLIFFGRSYENMDALVWMVWAL